MTQATLTFLGSGTSMGVPTLGCTCAVCLSAIAPPGAGQSSSRNRRTRPSVSIQFPSPRLDHFTAQIDSTRNDASQTEPAQPDQEVHTVLIDTGPDFHAQALREHITRVDAVFYTHSHVDHILGMDDLRPLSFRTPGNIPLYADEETASALRRIFHYTFRTEDRYPTSARVQLHPLPSKPGECVNVFGACFQRIPVRHGREVITGYRFGSAAYLTDLSDLPDESIPLLQNLDILVLDALRRAPHPSHSHLDKSVRLVETLKPRRAFFTHMSHDLDHHATEADLPSHIRLAYDGLKLDFQISGRLAQ